MTNEAKPQQGEYPAASDAMVDAYLKAQRAAVEEADRFGRPNVGGLHTNTVREACRAGLNAAIAARGAAQAVPAGDWIAAGDINRLVRELDVALNGEADAAVQASLCDVVAQVCRVSRMVGRPLLAAAPAQDAEDAALLDWLERAGPTSICVVQDRPFDGDYEVSTDEVTGYGKTLRDAIRAARAQAAQPEGGA